MSVFLQFPQETVDSLVDYLYETEGLQQMRICSLIHHSFTPRAQYYLFSSIRFSSNIAPGEKYRSQRIQYFNKILHRKPYIAEFVRDIHLCLSPSDAEWISEDSDFIDTMRLLVSSGSALRKFVLERKPHLWSPKIVNPRSFMKEFVQPIVAPVTSLEIRGMQGIPTDFIPSFANLKTLVVDDVVFDGPALDIPPTSYPRVLDFDLRGQMDRVPGISGLTDTQKIYGLDVTRLNCLKASIQSPMMCRMVNGIFSLAAGHLTSLSLLLNDGYVKITKIHRLKRLRVLELHFNTHRNFLLQMSDIIHSLSPDGPLEEINTQVDLEANERSWEEFMGASGSDQWTQLDTTLSAISSQKEFRYTCLICIYHHTSQFDEIRSRLLDNIKGKLPLASATPKLSIYHDLLLNK